MKTTRQMILAVALSAAIAVSGISGETASAEVPGPPYMADATDPAATTLAHDLGISIEEARRRIGWQGPATQLGDELGLMLGERFGGLWFDKDGGGRVKVGIVFGADAQVVEHAQRLIDQWQLATVTDLVPVQTSYAQLERDSGWLGSLVQEANEGASKELASSTLVDHNRLRLKLRIPSGVALTPAQESAVDLARERLGDSLAIASWSGSVERQACTYREEKFVCDAPLRGGLTLYLENGTPWCTTAFYARSLSDNKPYIMTAGHCIFYGGSGFYKAWQPKTGIFHVIGQPHNYSFEGNDDYAIIRIDRPGVDAWNPKPWVYVHESSETVLDPDYYIKGTETSPPDTRVCISGSNLLIITSCGEVQEINWNGETGLARAEYCSDPGDSGAPIYSDHYARGIHAGVVAGHEDDCLNALFQGVSEAAAELNVYVVTV